MNEDAFDTAELAELRERWAREPTPQLALQLAEVYGRQGMSESAVEVLEVALRNRPSHLSARVALGRYRMELGRVAESVEALEGVVEADPTHLVANKLLVKGYSELGEPQKARDRLDLYRLLNESDPEIGALQQLVAGGAEAAPRPAELEPAVPAEEEEESFAQVEAISPREVVPPTELDAVVDVETVPAPAEPAEPVALTPAEPAATAAVEPARGEPFPDLWRWLDEARYREGLLGELFGGAREAATPGDDEVSGGSLSLDAPEVDEEGASSVTLADLYSDQGHRGEAIRALRDVLSRDPENQEAMTRIAALVAAEDGDLTAFDLLDGADFARGVALEQRRSRLLRNYLDRISGGAGADV